MTMEQRMDQLEKRNKRLTMSPALLEVSALLVGHF